MPLMRLSAEQAQQNLRRNRTSIFPDGRVDHKRLNGMTRLAVRPSFTFDRDDRILTIGSCFAREIEARLAELGFDIPMAEIVKEGMSNANGILSKFTVHSMENELRWAAAEEPPPPPEKLFLEMSDGYWHDPQLVLGIKPEPLPIVMKRRRIVQDLFRQMQNCRVVILTLGLVEAWYDHEAGVYLNTAPPTEATRRYPGRFSVDTLTHDEILESLERMHAILSRAGHPQFNMLVTVSPVPFKATFFGDDALVANSYGKSVQRAAAEAFARAHDNVDYFPSYEIVTLSPREMVYEQDNIHVSRATVAHIMDTVLANYAPGLGVTPADVGQPESRRTDAELMSHDLAAKARHQLGERDHAGAAQTCRELFEQFQRVPGKVAGPALMTYASALISLDDMEGAAVQLAHATRVSPSNPHAFSKLGQVQLRLGRPEDAIRSFESALALDPAEPKYRQRLEAARIQLGRMREEAQPAG